MNNARLTRWFTLTPYTDPVTRHRAFSTYVVAVLLMAGGPIFFVPLLLTVVGRDNLSFENFATISLSALAVYGTSFAAILLTRAGAQRMGGRLLLILWAILVLVGITNIGSPIDGLSLSIALQIWVGISLTVLLNGVRALLAATVLAALSVIAFAFKVVPPAETNQPLSYVLPFSALVLSSLLAHVGINWLIARGLRDTVQRANLNAAKRLGLVEASNAVMQRVLSRLEMETLLREVVGLVRDTFADIDQAQVWLVDDERRNSVLTASSSGELTSQKVGVGSLSPVGRVSLGGEYILVRDLPTEQNYRRETLPPGIRCQLALPLKIASEVIGVLEVQSHQVDVFGRDDLEVLQTLADQIAIAIDNARLYASAQKSLIENQRLYEQTRSSLREIERLNQQLTGQAWNEYLRGQGNTPSFTLDLTSGDVAQFADWTPTLDQAAQTRQVVVLQGMQSKTVSLPITVRGQVIGAMEFELDADQSLTAEQITVMERVIERMGLSADNIRLFEEAQRIAQREAAVNAISARMQTSTNIDTVIASVTQSLAEALQTSRVSVRLGTPEPGLQKG